MDVTSQRTEDMADVSRGLTTKTVVVGIGNDFRGDDGAGLVAARELRKFVPAAVNIIELNNEVASLLEHLTGCDAAIIIDAVRSGAQPGTIHCFDASIEPLPGDHTQRSTHGISLGSMLELARTRGEFPRKVLVYGIEGESFEHGKAITLKVRLAVVQLVKLLQKELSGVSA